MKKIKVSFRGSPYGLDALKGVSQINGVVGFFDTILMAHREAQKHLEEWRRSYDNNRIGLRPITEYSRIMSWSDPSKVELFAYGGWGDSIFINYKFEFEEV